MTYLAGQHYKICDVCGFKFHSDQTRKRWDGLLVCFDDYETDHPQKFVRVEADGKAVPDPRPRPQDVFALPVYCSPFTRTAAADDGTADCATVGYSINLNYRDYGYYQPIILEPSTPTPILLDTFTAADGTDPTARDMDVYITGQSRWQTRPPTAPGSIQANTFGPSGTSGGVWTIAEILYQLPGLGPVIGANYPFALVLKECRSYAIWIDAIGFTSGNETIRAIWFNGVLYGELTDSTGTASALLNHTLPQGDGTIHNLAIWADGANFHLIVDGASVASTSYSIGSIACNNFSLQIAGDGTPDTQPRDKVGSFGYYEGLTLAQTIALTT